MSKGQASLMSLTQIPFQDPVAPPEKHEPEQLDLYDARNWETAYRVSDDEARVPHLLIQLQDDLTRSRRREAAWISIIVHLLLIIFIFKFEALEKYFPWVHSIAVAVRQNPLQGKDVTFLELPPDLEKVPQRPKTNIASDKNRIAMTRHPQLDPKELRKILATPPPGTPGGNGQRAGQPPAQSAGALAQNQPPDQTQQRPQQAPNPETAQLQMPAKPNVADVFKKYGAPSSAGSQINEAAEAAAAARGAGQGQGGDFGLGTGAHGRQLGNLEVLSDTMGVDFGPYLQRVLHDVRQNWYTAIPESAQWKKGKLAIEFAITKDGKVAGMKLVASSGDVPLDRAAWAGITASDPFPPLPSEFGGEYLALRFIFFYNPSKEDLE
ncbi:MAG: cell envelope integrity protein TolA [Candidatus Sulfotelmatobacter sp.]